MDGIQHSLAAQTVRSAENGDLARMTRVRDAAGRGDTDKAAKMFEELLATMLVREMRRGLGEGFFGGGAGSDVYEGWLDEHVGRSLSSDGSLDLAQAIRRSLEVKAASAAEERQP
jgi:Rod binding domain-containing protein